jgi:CubicO group peptidase (beta-lactamase class C family)
MKIKISDRNDSRSLLCPILTGLLILLPGPAPSGELVFPVPSWTTIPPETVGLDPLILQDLQDLVGGSGMIVRYGYQAWSWGDITEPQNWASASKPVLSTLLFMAVDEGRCTFGSTMSLYHSGGSAKDRAITFYDLANNISGYSRGEDPGEAWAYNDFAINLYGYTISYGVYGEAPSTLFPSKLSFLGFEDPVIFSDAQYGRVVGMSIRDFSRLGLLWLARGIWDGTSRVADSNFDL